MKIKRFRSIKAQIFRETTWIECFCLIFSWNINKLSLLGHWLWDRNRQLMTSFYINQGHNCGKGMIISMHEWKQTCTLHHWGYWTEAGAELWSVLGSLNRTRPIAISQYPHRDVHTQSIHTLARQGGMNLCNSLNIHLRCAYIKIHLCGSIF